jgi:hypothetical protein
MPWANHAERIAVAQAMDDPAGERARRRREVRWDSPTDIPQVNSATALCWPTTSGHTFLGVVDLRVCLGGSAGASRRGRGADRNGGREPYV